MQQACDLLFDGRGFQVRFNRRARSRNELAQILIRVFSRLDRLSDHYIDPARSRGKRCLWQQLESSSDRNRHNRNTCADRNFERSVLELLEPSVRSTSAFRKDSKRLACSNSLNYTAQALCRLSGIASIDWKISGRPEMPSHKRHVKQFLLCHDSELVWQVSKKGGDVDQARMVRHVNVVLVGPDILGSRNANSRKDAPGN